ncbi:MAG: hypothetical protein LLG20_03890, partial [Acidobacteriales bacterium]|nr:hypothetical protein [Terriglobales bacterium]
VRKYGPGLAVEVSAPPGIQVVFGQRDAGATHVLSLVNLYTGLAASGGSINPQVGPVKVTIPLRVFVTRPKAVQAIDAQGMRWRAGQQALDIDIATVGHHAVLVIT